MAGVNAALDVVFGFLLDWPPLVAILLVSAVVSVIMVLAYKFFTDQGEMKRLKDDLAKHQKRVRELKDDPEKMMAVQRQMMAVNMQYMKKSMKPTFLTFLPIILIFGWMNAHFAFEPLMPSEEFTLTAFVKSPGNVSIVVPDGLEVIGGSEVISVSRDSSWLFGLFSQIDNAAVFRLRGEDGKRLVTLKSQGEEVDREVIVSAARDYAPPSQAYDGAVFSKVDLGNEELIVFWRIGWLGTYILLAIGLSSLLRKLLKVY